MPQMTATQLLKAIAKANGTIFGEAEMRGYENTSIKKLIGNQNEVFMNLKTLKKSDEQPTKAILFNRQYVASGTAKQHNHTGSYQDTFEKDIAYIKRQQKFAVSYKMADNNQFGYQEILNARLKNAFLNLYEDISTYIASWLDTNRSQVGVDSLIAFDETTNYQFDNPVAEKDWLFDNIKAAMKKNKYKGVMDVIGTQRNAKEYRRIGAQGSANSTNLSYTIPGFDFVEEEQLTDSAGGHSYVFQKGMVGMSTWNERANRNGEGSPGSNEGWFTTIKDPIFGMSMDVHVMRSVADTSGSNGNVQDIVDEWEITPIFTVQGAYISVANETPIFKFVQGT